MLLLIGIFLTILSCSTEPENQSYINISDQYEIKIHQELSPEGGLPSIVLKTLEKQDCLNSYISNHTIYSEGKTQIFINEILVEGECISGNDFIDEEIKINSDHSHQDVEIVVKNIIHNHGIIQSTDEDIDLQLDNFDGLKVVKTHIHRIQPKMFWGSFSSNNSELINALQEYIGEIDLHLSKIKGDYGWFYMDNNENVSVYESENDYGFMISTEEDLEKITLKLLEFKELDSSLVFQATNYDGRVINID